MNKILKFIDTVTDDITMYRLVLYYVAMLWGVALFFSVVSILPLSPLALIASAGVLVVVTLVTNELFAVVFGAPSNRESVLITAGILALIISPTVSLSGIAFLIWAAVWAMAAKYILAINKKHIFNPAAFAVALTALTINQSASWWVANAALLPFVIMGGVAMVRKIHRADLVLSFLAVAVAAAVGGSIAAGSSVLVTLKQITIYSPLAFFAFVMLTEPMTTPPRRAGRIAYGALTGFLFAPFVHLGSLYSTPELALLVSNIFSYLISPKRKLVLRLKEAFEVTPDIADFVFVPDQKFSFRPGQYLEWTLGHRSQDNRGMRRFFTIASSPTEPELRLGVKFYDKSSSYKQAMLKMKPGDTIVAGQLAGDFTLPKDKKQKLVFIAGGIGVTPFRSMIKYLSDNSERRDIVLLYANKSVRDIAYADIFETVAARVNLRTVYTVSEAPPRQECGVINRRIDGALIRELVPDWFERGFYISGSQAMVISCREALLDMGVSARRIRTDYFPGLA